MNIVFFHTLAAVIRHGSFAAAASEVNLTASAVGLQIKQLENYLGQPLFDRSARSVKPTPFAHEVMATVQDTLHALDGLRSRTNTTVSGHLRLGVIESAQISLLPRAMLALRSTAPLLELHCIRGVSKFLLDELKAGRIDVAVLVRPHTGGSSRLHWMPLFSERFVLVTPPRVGGGTPRELLARHDWIRLDRSATGGRIAASYVEKLVPGKRCLLELPGTDAIVAMVSAGLGVSVIPSVRAEMRAIYDINEVSLGSKSPTRQIVMVCRPADIDDRRIKAVHQSFHSASQSLSTAI